MMFTQVFRLLAIPFALVFCLPVLAEESKPDMRLIAHRGGVVDDRHTEHSFEGLRAAIDRGYWMVEVDVRETKDGFPIVHHDANFSRYYGDSRQVAELAWSQIRQLRATPDDTRPLLLDEFLEACQGKIQLMLEMKGPSHDLVYYQSIEKVLREKGLLQGVFMIGLSEAKSHFKGKLRISLQREGLREALAAGEDVSPLYFLFEDAKTLDEKTIRMARKAGVPIVAGVNRHHYRGENAMQQAHRDLARMKRLGIRSFQIDSMYDRWFLR